MLRKNLRAAAVASFGTGNLNAYYFNGEADIRRDSVGLIGCAFFAYPSFRETLKVAPGLLLGYVLPIALKNIIQTCSGASPQLSLYISSQLVTAACIGLHQHPLAQTARESEQKSNLGLR